MKLQNEPDVLAFAQLLEKFIQPLEDGKERGPGRLVRPIDERQVVFDVRRQANAHQRHLLVCEQLKVNLL